MKKEFFRNNDLLDVVTGDAVIVDVPNGHHLGYISMQGELVRLQMQKKKIKLKKCKVCTGEFKPFNTTQIVCDYVCATAYAKLKEKQAKVLPEDKDKLLIFYCGGYT